MILDFNPLHNFISPVTGRLPIDPNYVLIGDRAGMSIASPILIDLRLDLIDLRKDFNTLLDSYFVLNYPNSLLPNAQSLSLLEDGYMYNTEGIITTTPTIPIGGLPDLAYKKIWIGDINNRPAERSTIYFDNLPDLGVGTVTIPNPFDPSAPIVLTRGKIWRGTDSNRPEESNAVTSLEVEGLLLTARFLTSAWILRNSGLIPRPLRPITWPNAQFLDDLTTNSLLKHTTNGTIAVATLTQNKFWIGDVNNLPVETDKLPASGLPDLSKGHFWTGDANNRPIESALPHKNIIIGNDQNLLGYTLTLFIDNLPDLTFGAIWIGDQTNRPVQATLLHKQLFIGQADNTIGVTIKIDIDNLPDLQQDYLFIGDANNRPAPTLLIKVLNLPNLTQNNIWVGDANNRPVESNKLPIGTLPDLQQNYIWIGDVNNRPAPQLTIQRDNLPNLTFNAIWRGNVGNRPIESQSLTQLEAKVTNIEDVLIPGLEAEIAALEAEIIGIQAEITIIQGQITLLEGAVAILQGQVLAIIGQVADLTSRVNTLESEVATIQQQIIVIIQRLDNLRLNNIPADGDVSFYNFKLINLADPTNPTDGVNLRTLINYINNVPTTIELIGDVTGSGNTGTPIPTTLQLTLDQIKIAQNTVNLNNQKISNLKSDEVEQQDAINAKFLWDLMHDQVGVVWQ